MGTHVNSALGQINVTLVVLETLKSNHFTYYPPSKSNNYFAIKLSTVWALFFADRVIFLFYLVYLGVRTKVVEQKFQINLFQAIQGNYLLGTYMYCLKP